MADRLAFYDLPGILCSGRIVGHSESDRRLPREPESPYGKSDPEAPPARSVGIFERREEKLQPAKTSYDNDP